MRQAPHKKGLSGPKCPWCWDEKFCSRRLRQRLSPGLLEMKLSRRWWTWRIRKGEQGRASSSLHCWPRQGMVTDPGPLTTSDGRARSQTWTLRKIDLDLFLWHCWSRVFKIFPRGKERTHTKWLFSTSNYAGFHAYFISVHLTIPVRESFLLMWKQNI